MGQIDSIMNDIDTLDIDIKRKIRIDDILQKYLEPQKKEKEDKKDKIKLLPMTYDQWSPQEWVMQTLPDRLNIIKNIETLVSYINQSNKKPS